MQEEDQVIPHQSSYHLSAAAQSETAPGKRVESGGNLNDKTNGSNCSGGRDVSTNDDNSYEENQSAAVIIRTTAATTSSNSSSVLTSAYKELV